MTSMPLVSLYKTPYFRSPPRRHQINLKATDFAPKSVAFGPSGEIRTPGVLNPNQVPYQLGHTRILSYEKKLVVVKYVVKEILPHFRGTFKSGDWGKLGRNRGVRNISDSRTGLVLQLPNQAPYQLGHTRICVNFSERHYTRKRSKKQSPSLGFHLGVAQEKRRWYNRSNIS